MNMRTRCLGAFFPRFAARSASGCRLGSRGLLTPRSGSNPSRTERAPCHTHQGGKRGRSGAAGAGSGSGAAAAASARGATCTCAVMGGGSFGAAGFLGSQARPKWRRRRRQPRKASPGSVLPLRAVCKPMSCNATRAWPKRACAFSQPWPSACNWPWKACQRSRTATDLPGTASIKRCKSAASAVAPVALCESGAKRPSAAEASPHASDCPSCSGSSRAAGRNARRRARASSDRGSPHFWRRSSMKKCRNCSRNFSPSGC
mmetsp:Transcript_86600/g.193635  ORF Transcript_86600/g.193635 Transcript_86600/m.193635 type:complete len:260 (-) Transcript_86600:580-1359(-)